jgi:hypothetical protein
MPVTPDRRWCQVKRERHSPHVWGGRGHKYLCAGNYPKLARATARGHGELATGQFLYFGDGDVPRAYYQTRGACELELTDAGSGFEYAVLNAEGRVAEFGKNKMFWAAPMPDGSVQS